MGLSLCAQGPRQALHSLSAEMSEEISQDDTGQAESRPLGVFGGACLSIGTLESHLNCLGLSFPFPLSKMKRMKATS